jgi:hypothetical protein
MPTSFNSAAFKIDNTRQVVLTGVKTIVLNVQATNKTGGTIPVSLILVKGGVDYYLRKKFRLAGNDSQNLLKGRLVLQANESLICSTEQTYINEQGIVTPVDGIDLSISGFQGVA